MSGKSACNHGLMPTFRSQLIDRVCWERWKSWITKYYKKSGVRPMSEPQNRTLNKIHDYLEGSLNEEQVDELWAELLSDDEAFDYMQTLAMLRKMERSEIRDPSSEPVPYELPRESRKPAVYFLRVAAAVAAVLLITVFTIYQSPDFGNAGVSAPLTSVDYGIERSGDIPNRVESVKSRVIELSVLDKTDEAILYIDQEL